ncbi:UTP--glucose-1-phosphate uridylyltransferase [Candidatus Lucifugimonas marina]|uniref:UTP--glucose-1-phosphate uridylyltransferase n=1 Tax=Candidatus Lucifugimonas marina TaxID=3038979 RepID=A0AAJ5ZDI6_9CHLR|nr:NTP transferase domain-containing protein [SAR202 cluster bacterium JH702]MDG0868857.1 NTP transferase domain-containing protein [SAR202 cluster bacterium JH639]WFG35485.1 NTP transferase domain-containing protein [SAR202 cluster bacterium JH545]WFG39432.1 NTP transferase domain-containing protein [SAR202 cluster bacterium JH1073]
MSSQSSEKPAITKAVIPVGGLGTRFLPATRTVPKPLLPVLNVPVIEYAVRDAAEAGVTDVAIVMSPGMESVADYFGNQATLERELRTRGRDDLLEKQLEIASLVNVTTVYQHDPKGPGHAILQARDFCDGESFVTIFPDDVILNDVSATEQLMQVYREHGGSVLAVSEAADEIIHTKGVVGGTPLGSRVHEVDALVEKPALEDAPSKLAIVARYILDNAVFDYLAEEHAGAGGEIQITDAIASLLGNSPIHAREISGFHADTGNPGGMLQAAIHVAKQDPELAEIVADALQG